MVFLYLAPLRGLTEAGFRKIFFAHFQGWNSTVAPFINPQQKALYDDKMLRDVLPVNNSGIDLVPQLLHTDPEEFLVLAERLFDMGYRQINWNLGCPAPMVARKNRGSGLLPHAERVVAILDAVLPKLKGSLSIKTRLGYNENTELLNLLPRLAAYPLHEIIIHTRLGRQIYRGKTDPDTFALCIERTHHPLVYNGDINSIDDYHVLAKRFPNINRWMMGRGAIGNPFLAEEIKYNNDESYDRRTERLRTFHDELYNHYTTQLSGPGHILGKLKQFWTYFISSFPENPKGLKQILKCHTTEKYIQTVDTIFATRQR